MLAVDTRPADGDGADAEQQAGTSGIALRDGTLRSVRLYKSGIGSLLGMLAPAEKS